MKSILLVSRSRWTIKGPLRRWWHVKLWTEFFDDFLNPKSEEKAALPSLARKYSPLIG